MYIELIDAADNKKRKLIIYIEVGKRTKKKWL